MKCKLALVAKDVIVSHDTNVPSAINILEGIRSGGFPLFIQGIAFLTVWAKEQGDPEEHTGNVIVKLNEKELIKEQVKFSFAGRSNVRNITEFQGLVIPQPGDLEFRAEFGRVVGSYHINVSLQPPVEAPRSDQSASPPVIQTATA